MLNNLFSRRQNTEYLQETIDILRLIRSENVGYKTFFHAIKLFGSASLSLENIAELSVKGGRKKPITIYPLSKAEQEIERMNKEKAYFLTYKDFNYSDLLLQTHDFPPILTYKGDASLLKSDKIVAMVGARNSSLNSRNFAGSLASELVSAGYITVSGLAKGIDTAVHTSSGSNTIAVIAGGIDHIYPPENKKLFAKIAEESLLIAELPIGTSPLARHFPQRNRIISGIALATIVIEAGLKSGSLITANFALEQNRDVFACPGFPLDPRCMGSNKLIKEGAYLLESAEDVINNLSTHTKIKKSLAENSNDSNFKMPESFDIKELERSQVLDVLSSSPVSYEALSSETGLQMPIVYTICLELELAGRIARHIGNKISLIY